MSAVSETIVREYFELHGFFVRQQRKYVSRNRPEDEEVDFFVLNPRYQAGGAAPFVLTPADLRAIDRAVVVVKGWHTETFSTAVLAHAPKIFRFVQPPVFQQAARAFGVDGPLTKILIVPALPQAAQARDQSVELLRGKGIDAVIPFHTMLSDLIQHIEVNRDYQKSDLLQIIRIFKNYDFFKEQQLDLFKGKRQRRNRSTEPPA
jgi:hypothetical protein